MTYFDGFVIPVPTAKRDVYRDYEAHWWPSFRKRGALQLVVAWGDDVPQGKQTDFARAVALRPDEIVVFAWLTWPDKATRDAAAKDMMADADMSMADMPFDGARMIYGGFTPIFDSEEPK